MNIKSISTQYNKWIWAEPAANLSSAVNKAIIAIRILHLVIRDLKEGMITLRAMGLVYTTILALVPLIAVSFSVLKGFGVHNQIEPMLLILLEPLGDKGAEITHKLIEFVDNTKAGVLGTLGMLLLLYTVVSLLQKIERSFNYTWRVTHHRPIRQRFSDYLTVVFIWPVLLFTALGLTASLSSMTIMEKVSQYETIGFLFNVVGMLVPYLLVIAAFTFIYIFIPNARVKFSAALAGGIVSGVLWESASWLFATFVANSVNYTAIYSAFATMIIFVIWLYVIWLILLVGCSISFYAQSPGFRTLERYSTNVSNRQREMIALNIMFLVGKAFYYKKSPLTIDCLVKQMCIGNELTEYIIGRMLKAKLLIETSGPSEAYVPYGDLEQLLISDIVSSVRDINNNNQIDSNAHHIDPVISTLQYEIDQSIMNKLSGLTIKDIIVDEVWVERLN